MRTECVRLATLPLGRPRILHLSLSLSVSVARRSFRRERRAFIYQEEARAHTNTDGTVRARTHAHTSTGQAGNMTSSYSLDFLPDMMVESRLLVPADRM